jgi:hypothetical protein
VPATPANLQNFVYFCKQHIKGDEKGESQTFLNQFFQAFGHEGALQAGATFEKRVAKGSKKDKIGFADLVWKPRVLIEMKKRGEDLNKHYTQVEKYWMRLALIDLDMQCSAILMSSGFMTSITRSIFR